MTVLLLLVVNGPNSFFYDETPLWESSTGVGYGTDIRENQELLEHKSVETTIIYTHVIRVNSANEII